jgi:DNA-binding CsgD family transcriptional regulator
LRGDYAAAAAQIEQARMLWQSDAARQHACQSLLLLRDLGQLEDLTDELRLPDHLYPWRQAAQAHRLLLALARGQQTAAQADYEALVAHDFSRVRVDHHWLATLAPLAEAAVIFSDAPRAARLRAWLAPYAERLMVDGSLVVCHGPVALYLGQLAGVLGRWDEAIQRLDQARLICERLGLQPFLARTLLAHAEVLTRRDGPGDRAAARDLSQRAMNVASAIGMLGLIPHTTALRETLSDPAGAAFGLTPRELDVLRLMARGLTDAEVAEQLFLSPRTVGTHLTSIYGKLGVSSRTAAARIAIERGLP